MDCRYTRKSHSRNISQSSTNEDVLNLLLVSLDPLISSLRRLPKKAVKTYLPEALKLFSNPKEMEDLISSDAAITEGNSVDTSEEISNK
jgi:hypothetical protein